MQFVNAIKFGFKNYFNFRGRVDRTTFWLWMLFVLAVVIITQPAPFLALVIAIPTIALTVRRYRDAGVRLSWLLLWLIPAVPAFGIVDAILSGTFSGPWVQSFMDTGIIGVILLLFVAALMVVAFVPVAIVHIVFLSKPSKY